MTQTIQLNQDTKDTFEKVRFRLKYNEGRLITQSEFIKILLKSYKENKKWD